MSWGGPALRRPHIGHGHSRAEPVALVRTRQFAANSCHSLWVLRAAFGSLARTRSCACRQRLGVAGVSRREAAMARAHHAREWRVLAGFWREKAGAGRVPSFISGCAAAKMLEGVFRALSAWREGALGSIPPIPRRAFAARSLLSCTAGGGGRHPRTRRLRTCFRRRTHDELHLQELHSGRSHGDV